MQQLSATSGGSQDPTQMHLQYTKGMWQPDVEDWTSSHKEQQRFVREKQAEV